MFQVSIATRQPFICIIFTLKHLFYRHTFIKNVVRIQIITTSDNSGNYTEKGLGTGNSLYIWQPAYQGIRHLSVFLNNIDMNKEFSEPEIADMKGQAHFSV